MIKVPDPFRWLGDDGQWRLFLLVSILSIAVMVALDDQGSHLKTEASPWERCWRVSSMWSRTVP
jgi:hypothetical protein